MPELRITIFLEWSGSFFTSGLKPFVDGASINSAFKDGINGELNVYNGFSPDLIKNNKITDYCFLGTV